jgi:DNA-binding transcriptional MerR regulator
MVLVSRETIVARTGIKSRQFWDWQKRGLLPRYVKWVHYGGDGSQALYDESVIELVERIQFLRAMGKSYDEIAEDLEIKRAKEGVREERGFVKLPSVKVNPDIRKAVNALRRKLEARYGEGCVSGFYYSLEEREGAKYIKPARVVLDFRD